MSPSAQQTHLEFVRLAAEEPSSLYFEDFLRSGYSAWPDSYQRRFPDLSSWPGIAGLQTRLKQLAGGPASDQVLISSRSAELMKLAARVLCKTCRGIFTTDFSWPTYQNILQHEAKRTGNRVHVASLRTSVLRERMPPEQLIARIVREFIDQNCDGLFLPAVDNLGVRLPIGEIVPRYANSPSCVS
jgi:histidinol-phosphate/aromatic aminotransferase/cobyric acid decarboxylase-like protein